MPKANRLTHETGRRPAKTCRLAGGALSSASLLTLATMLASAPQPARAANECGAQTSTPQTLSCAGGTYAAGISYTGSGGLTLNLNDPTITVSETVALKGAGGDLTVNATNFTSLQGNGSIDVVQSGAGNAVISIGGGGSISSTGATTVEAQNTGSGAAVVTMTNGNVSGGAGFVAGALLATADSGPAQVNLSGGKVTTTVASGFAVDAVSATGAATITMTGGAVLTSGSGGDGLRATVSGSSATSATSVLLSGGTVTTTGSSAHGLVSQATGGEAIIQMTGGTVTVSGSGADGLFATSTTGAYNISVTGGALTGGAGAGAAIAASAGAGGVIAIGSGAVVNAGASGVVLNATGGAAAITTAGALTGNINLAAAGNSLDITGGSIAGNISGGGATALGFDLGAGGAFTYGAPFTMSGLGSLAMNSGTATLAGAATAGSVTVTGGTLIVTGAVNTPAFALNGGVLSVGSDANLGSGAGALNFNGGALQVTGTSFTSMARAITWGANGGGFDIADAANTFTVAQTLAGGPLTKAGAGTLALTAADSFTGGATIAAGTLQIGAGGTAGSITGDVADNGTLAFDRSDAVTFAGAISGTGAVTQIGSGQTTLSGADTYSGGTTISAGVLEGSAASFGAGGIRDDAALIVDQASDGTMANPINGAGSFTKTGAGLLTYTGTGGLTGPTTVAAGTLAMNGALAASAFTVQSGAVLRGSGTVGATTIQTGGTIAPGGDAIGVLHVNGAFVQQAGSTFLVRIDAKPIVSDQISVTGSATLAPGAALNVVRSGTGNFHAGAVYTVLDATGGVSGTYGLTGEERISPFLAVKDSYDADHVYLTVVQTAAAASAATTANERGAASGLPSSGDLPDAVLNTSGGAATQRVLSELAGDGHAAAKGALVSDSRLVRDLAIGRVEDLFCSPTGATGALTGSASTPEAACAENGRPAAWGQAFGAWGRTDGDGDAGETHRTTGGVLLGADTPVFGTWRVGGFLGYSQTTMAMDGSASAEIDNYHLGAYGGTQYGPLGLRFGAAYTHNDIHTDRSVSLPNIAEQQLEAGYGADFIQGFAQAGYRLNFGRAGLEPFLEAAYVDVHTDGFTETGGVAALAGHADDIDAVYSTLGVKPSIKWSFDHSELTLHGVLGWRHDYGDVTPTSTMQYVAGGSPFNVEGAPLARDGGVAELGLDMKGGNTVFGLAYGAQGWMHDFDQTVRADIRVAF